MTKSVSKIDSMLIYLCGTQYERWVQDRVIPGRVCRAGLSVVDTCQSGFRMLLLRGRQRVSIDGRYKDL